MQAFLSYWTRAQVHGRIVEISLLLLDIRGSASCLGCGHLPGRTADLHGQCCSASGTDRPAMLTPVHTLCLLVATSLVCGGCFSLPSTWFTQCLALCFAHSHALTYACGHSWALLLQAATTHKRLLTAMSLCSPRCTQRCIMSSLFPPLHRSPRLTCVTAQLLHCLDSLAGCCQLVCFVEQYFLWTLAG